MIVRSWLGHVGRRSRSGETGQIAFVAAGLMVFLLGAGALAIDIGFFARTKRELQNDADAMALAGAQEIPDQMLARSKAREWGTNNGADLDEELVSIEFNVSCSGAPAANTITVRLQRSQPTYLARALGITEGTMHACASAGRFSLGGGSGMVPWALEDDCFDAVTYGASYTLKYDSDATSGECNGGQGNFGAVGIDDTGVGSNCTSYPGPDDERKYRRAICFGAVRELCSINAPDCVGEDGDDCSSEHVSGHEMCTETGNMAGPTGDGVQWRVDHTEYPCNTWDGVFQSEAEGGPGIESQCNPWREGGPQFQSQQLIIVPIVDGLWDSGGTHKVTIVDFAVFFLEAPPQCTGSNCDITGRFIQTGLPASVRAPLDPNSSVTMVALME